MKPMVYIVPNAGKINKEFFESDQMASTYAKTRSTGHGNLCSIYRTTNNKLFFYENGSIANGNRIKELNKIVQEIILQNYSKEM